MCPSILHFRLQFQLQMSMPSCCKECVQVRMGNLYSSSKTGMITFQYVVGSTTVVTNTQPCWADATVCYPVSLDVGVNAVDHTVPSNNTGLTLNAFVWSCSTPSFSSPSFPSPANSTPATSSVIFQSCKFPTCDFVRHFPVLQIPVLQIQLSHLETPCDIDSKRAFPTGVLDR